MSVLRRIKKNVEKFTLKFPLDMYNNVVGSLVITCYMLNEPKPSISEIKKRWRKLKKQGLNFWLDDKEFIEKVAKLFDLEVPYGKLAFVQSELNALYLPYIEETVLPIREDGIYPLSARKGKIYPIMEKVNESGSSE